MGVVLVSNYGIQGVQEKLKSIKWFFYFAGINSGGGMGDDGLYSYIKSDNPAELEKQLINLWGLAQGKYCYYYKDTLSLHFSADQINRYLYIRLQKYNHLHDRLQTEDFEIVEKFDKILDALNLEYYPYEYNMDPIYGESFKGKGIIKRAEHFLYPKEEWITYSEWGQINAKQKERMAESARRFEQSRKKGILKRLSSFLGFSKHS